LWSQASLGKKEYLNNLKQKKKKKKERRKKAGGMAQVAEHACLSKLKALSSN
jgi:hypothetical protein